ncbi:MAG: alpha-ketoglutarate-dependent dioxygenase AlkB [Clostridia bacterium]|nr:alpha-ketoglutarate-dependent dioxygenase AlkB [Deltaproteobacteria bacterium]
MTFVNLPYLWMLQSFNSRDTGPFAMIGRRDSIWIMDNALPHDTLIDDGGLLEYYGRVISTGDADRLFSTLERETPWQRGRLHIYGREVLEPRLTCWYGDLGASYTYSGRTVNPLPWTDTLSETRGKVESVARSRFNSVLLNLYRDGNDSVAWHADNEPELGDEPVIASLSVGVARRFAVRRRDRVGSTVRIDLGHGALVVMRGDFQRHWEHSIPKTSRPVQARINLTFRAISVP